MTILFRYVLRSFAVPAALCLVGLCALTMLFMSFDLISACFDPQANVTLQMVLDFLFGTLSMYTEWLLPAVFLLATLYTMWQFCRHSELIAMRASGIGMGTIVLPIVLLALLAAALSFLCTEFYKPIAAERAKLIKQSDFTISGRAPLSVKGCVIMEGDRKVRMWAIGSLDPLNPSELQQVSLSCYREDESLLVRYEAREARYLDGQWCLVDVTETTYDELDHVLAINQLPSKFLSTIETPTDILAQNLDPELASAASSKARYESRKREGKLTSRQKDREAYDIYHHYAAPVAIVLVTLFAIPAGIASGRQSVFRGIMLALSLFLAYYVVEALAMALSSHDVVKPALAVCLPSIVFGCAAVALFRKLR